jgi:carboxymethylenebutenolidase
MSRHEVATPTGPMPLHVAVPAGAGPWPGVVVLHDALGMTADLRHQADWLASVGYLAAAPDLYHRHPGRLRCMFGVISDVVCRHGAAFAAVDATRRWLVDRDDCTGQVGTIGFCMGGGFALLLAASGDYGAASINYGAVPKDALELLEGACPIVASYGGKDRGMARAPQRLESALNVHGSHTTSPSTPRPATPSSTTTTPTRCHAGPWSWGRSPPPSTTSPRPSTPEAASWRSSTPTSRHPAADRTRPPVQGRAGCARRLARRWAALLEPVGRSTGRWLLPSGGWPRSMEPLAPPRCRRFVEAP